MFCSINNQMNCKYEGDQEILKHLKFRLNTSKFLREHENTKIFIHIMDDKSNQLKSNG